MNYFTKESLLSNKNDIGNVVELNFNNESSAIISEYGGRLLGLFPKNDNYSLLWINPAIKKKFKVGSGILVEIDIGLALKENSFTKILKIGKNGFVLKD